MLGDGFENPEAMMEVRRWLYCPNSRFRFCGESRTREQWLHFMLCLSGPGAGGYETTFSEELHRVVDSDLSQTWCSCHGWNGM